MAGEDRVFGLGNLSTWQAAALAEGYTAREALGLFHDVGGGFVNFGTWYRNWAEVEDIMAREGMPSPVDLNQIPDASQLGTWRMGRGGEYVSNVRVTAQVRGTNVVTTSYYLHKSSDPFTPAEAIDAAMQSFGSDEAQASFSQDVLGAIPGPIAFTEPYTL